MNIKQSFSEIQSKSKQLAMLRKRMLKVEPVPSLKIQQGTIFQSLSISQQIQQIQSNDKNSIKHLIGLSENISMVRNNKIYHCVDESKPNINFKNQIQSLQTLQLQGKFAQRRPKTSQINKFKTGSEIFKANSDCLNFQNRPGSSKSSRLIKRKLTKGQERINSQNDEGTYPTLSKGRGNLPINTKAIIRRTRVGTSLSHIKKDQIVQSKLDPQFLKLFAS